MTKPILPVPTLGEALPYLRRPFAAAAVGFKVQQQGRKAALCVPYIDARLAIERLNLVVGANWTATYERAEEVGPRHLWCHLTVDGVTRSDVGEGDGKALISDSLKRAAVHFGVGRSLYAATRMFLKGEVKWLSDDHRAELRSRYETWLSSEGVKAFGAVLDHGDSEGSVGVALDAEAQRPLDTLPTPLEPERLAALLGRLPGSGAPERAKVIRDLWVKLGSLGISGSTLEAAFAKLTDAQADEIDAWLRSRK